MNNLFDDFYLELYLRVELRTSSLPRKCSTTELIQQQRAENGAQTRDPQLGRLVLYQLSYFRLSRLLKWVVMDSNHRRHRQQIYSLPHLATLVTTLTFLCLSALRHSHQLSLLSDSNQRPRDYKSRALAN